MSNQWFRMYAEFSTDPKVQMMSEAMQRRLLMLFCIRCNGDATLHDEEIMFQLRISGDEWTATKAEFIKRGFIDSDNNLVNWGKRQYLSDSSTERSRKHREAKKQTEQQECNVAATPPDTEQNRYRTEVKKEILKKSSPERFEEFWEIFPRTRRGNKQKAEAAYRQALSRCSADEILTGLNAYVDSAEVGVGFAKGATAWLNDDRWSSDYSAKEPIKASFKSFEQQAKDNTDLAMQEVLRRAQPN